MGSQRNRNKRSRTIQEKYVFYKEKCREMEDLINRFRGLLGEPSAISVVSPDKLDKAEIPSPKLSNVKKILFAESTSKTSNEPDQAAQSKEGPQQAGQSGSSHKRKYDDDHPLAKLRKMREGGEWDIMTNNPLWNVGRAAVSSKIKGSHRKEYTGWNCNNCEEYYEAAGLDQNAVNKCSKHRSEHKRLPSPKTMWGLGMEEFMSQSRYNDK